MHGLVAACECDGDPRTPTPGLALSCFPPAQLNSVGNVKEDSIAERDGMGGGDPIIPTCLRARARLTCSCLGRVIAPFGLTRAQRPAPASTRAEVRARLGR